MTQAALLRSWFVAAPIAEKWALPWIIVSLPVATLVRSTMGCPDPVGECCTPLFIFVLLTAILFGSRVAVVAALASLVASLLLFSNHAHGTAMVHGSGEFWGITLFVLYCAVIIGTVEFTRRTFARYSRLARPQELSSGVIFSLENGQAWASWRGSYSPVRLGPEPEVTEMMRDFIAQVELGQRLNSRFGCERERHS